MPQRLGKTPSAAICIVRIPDPGDDQHEQRSLRRVAPRVIANRYRHPHTGLFGRCLERALNSTRWARVRRAVLSRLPFLQLRSDVRDVVYLTWLLPVERCAALVPAGLTLWQRNGLTPFTVLTYRHRHFGPTLLGPLRRCCPSPLQSNWRLYLEQPPSDAAPVRTVLFVKNIMSSLMYAAATRLCSDALPTHLAAQFHHQFDGTCYHTSISPGDGSAPRLQATVQAVGDKHLPEPFAAVFGGWEQAVAFLACQDAAVAEVAGVAQLAFAEIHLPIDLAQVLPAVVHGAAPECPLLQEWQPVSGPWCFVVPAVRFTAISERLVAVQGNRA